MHRAGEVEREGRVDRYSRVERRSGGWKMMGDKKWRGEVKWWVRVLAALYIEGGRGFGRQEAKRKKNETSDRG